jgi:NAD(P)-dependent dehydrogenase (short-subunit alcohol dehydrogenase family)
VRIGLEEATGCSNAELWLCDLAEFASVKAFADRALKDLKRLDILMLNAAVAPGPNSPYTATKDGFETAYVLIA